MFLNGPHKTRRRGLNRRRIPPCIQVSLQFFSTPPPRAGGEQPASPPNPEGLGPRGTAAAARLKTALLLVMAVVILVPSMLGFAAKFVEFISTFRGETDGAFAITPMLNYLLASLGFFCMLVWATVNGMFRDIEQPKHRMLEIEAELDRREAASRTKPGC